MPQFSYARVSQDLMRYLRGRRSQRRFSKELGFDTNVAYTWESGRRFPEASVFLRAAERERPNLVQHFADFLGEHRPALRAGRVGSPRAVQALCEHWAGNHTRLELASALGVDRTTLARWLQGKTEPRLPQFLQLIDACTQRLLGFVAMVVDPGKLEATREAYLDMRAQQRLAYEYPWSHAILRALELTSYDQLPRHQPGFLARYIGLPADEEQRYLDRLKRAGQIRWDGTHWRVQRVLTVDTRTDPEKNRALKRHWAQVGVERLEGASTAQSALFSFNLFAISEASFQKIRELHLDYYDRVRSIIEESPSADRVVLMNLQMIPLELEGSDDESR